MKTKFAIQLLLLSTITASTLSASEATNAFTLRHDLYFTTTNLLNHFTYTPQTVSLSDGEEDWLFIEPLSKEPTTSSPYHWTNITVRVSKKPTVTESNGWWIIKFNGRKP